MASVNPGVSPSKTVVTVLVTVLQPVDRGNVLSPVQPRHRPGSVMSALTKILFALIAVILVGGAVFLASWDMPPPSEPVERVLPNERFFP